MAKKITNEIIIKNIETSLKAKDDGNNDNHKYQYILNHYYYY